MKTPSQVIAIALLGVLPLRRLCTNMTFFWATAQKFQRVHKYPGIQALA
jgi:hypothetical protein